MKTKPPPGSRRVTDWIGKQVRTLRPMKNGTTSIPKGTVCEVVNVTPGLHLKRAPCACCGVAIYITRIEPCDVEIIQPRPPEPTCCMRCDYEEADGVLLEQCGRCKAIDRARAAVSTAVVEAIVMIADQPTADFNVYPEAEVRRLANGETLFYDETRRALIYRGPMPPAAG